jgi:hypothetical protein
VPGDIVAALTVVALVAAALVVWRRAWSGLGVERLTVAPVLVRGIVPRDGGEGRVG